MSLPENYGSETAQIEREIERKGIILGIDWTDETQVQQLAHQAFHCRLGQIDCTMDDPLQRARIELFGMAQLMLEVMTKSAENGMQTHGGPAWKAFAHALWREREQAGASESAAPSASTRQPE